MSENSTNRSIVILTLNRLIINLPRRFPYVFLPPISKELGVATASVQTVIATQWGIGIGSPMLGPFLEQYGRKRIMLICLSAFTLIATLGAIRPIFAIFAFVTIALGVVKMIFDPTMQSYLADRIPYHRRGFALGVTELSWAGSLVVVALFVGFTLDKWGLGAVFGSLALFGAIGLVALWLWIPADVPLPDGVQVKRITPALVFHTLRANPAALGALLWSLCLSMSNEIVFINYSIWIEDKFDLSVTALGAATIVIASAEVIGELVVIGGSDRIGKRRLALVTAILSSMGYFVLPFLDFHLIAAMIGLFFVFIFFETAIVASLPLFTEVMPNARAVMMSSNMGAHSIGRLSGGLVGGVSYEVAKSFHIVGILALLVGMLATAAMYFFIQEHGHSDPLVVESGAHQS